MGLGETVNLGGSSRSVNRGLEGLGMVTDDGPVVSQFSTRLARPWQLGLK